MVAGRIRPESQVENTYYFVVGHTLQLLNLKEMSAQIASSLKLESEPVGVKFFEKAEEGATRGMLVKNGFERPREPLNTCQLVGLARIQRKKVFAGSEDMACVVGGVVLGLTQEPEIMKKGYLALASKKDLESAAEFIGTIPKVADRQIGLVAFGPLASMPLEPDVVVVYGNSLQVMELIGSYLWDKRGRVEVALGGEFSVCGDVVAKTYVTQRLQFSIPCKGERTSAGVSDSELSVGIPGRDLEGLCKALRKPEFQVSSLTERYALDKTPTYFPDTYLTSGGRKFKKEARK